MDSRTKKINGEALSNQKLPQRQILIPFLLLILICSVTGSGYVYLTTKTLDKQELEQTTQLAEAAISAQLEELGNWCKYYGLWDATVNNVVEHLDRGWANDNIGQYLYDSFNIHQSYAISSDDRTIIGYRDGEKLVEADLLTTFPPEIKILIQQTQASPPKDPQAVSGILRHNGKILLVAASVITSEYPGLEDRSALPRPVLVLVRVLNDELLAATADRYLLKGLQWNRPIDPIGFGTSDLRDPAGKVLGQLSWRLHAPGKGLFLQWLPMFALVLLILAVLTLQFLRRMGLFSKEKNEMEIGLAKSEERLSSALQITNICLWDWDIKSDTSYFNPTYYTMSGYAPDEFGASFRNFLKVVHIDDQAMVNQAINEHFSGMSGKYEVEFRLLHKEGGWIWVKSQGEIISRDKRGNPLRMIGIHADVTKQKKAEATKTALEVQLHQKNKMEAIGTMAGGIAHDFNNLLVIIRGNVALLQRKHKNGTSFDRNLEYINQSTNRAIDLVRQILTFSRHQEIELKPIDLLIVIEGSLRLLRSTLPSTVDIVRSGLNESILINADVTQLQQICFNLCNNAVHAMESKGLLTVTLHQIELSADEIPATTNLQTGRYAKLTVTDTGRGMDKETIARIFEPFFTTKIVGEGTGMGLSVVYGIVDSHGGFITVESTLGQGTCFNIYFPTIDERRQRPEDTATQTSPFW